MGAWFSHDCNDGMKILLNHLGALVVVEYLDGFGLGSGGVPVSGRFQKK
jgi:hypothetical protein